MVWDFVGRRSENEKLIKTQKRNRLLFNLAAGITIQEYTVLA